MPGRFFLVLLVGTVALASLLAVVPTLPPPLPTPHSLQPPAASLILRIEGKGWGDASAENIQKVLESAGRELLRDIPRERPIRIHVVPTGKVPQVDFRRSIDGEFTVRLAVRDKHWAQFAFQFAHELGHIVSHYERRGDNKLGVENQWFEEAVGETASLFVLTRMAQTWKTHPPYANWKGYAPSLADYAAKRIKEIEAPARARMPAWFEGNRAALRADPYLRNRNRVVAAHLLRMIERNPANWEAFHYLNLGRPDSTNSFESYLENWYFSAPRSFKPFVKGVGDLLGVKSELIAGHASK